MSQMFKKRPLLYIKWLKLNSIHISLPFMDGCGTRKECAVIMLSSLLDHPHSGLIQWLVAGSLVMNTTSQKFENLSSQPRDLGRKLVLGATYHNFIIWRNHDFSDKIRRQTKGTFLIVIQTIFFWDLCGDIIIAFHLIGVQTFYLGANFAKT